MAGGIDWFRWHHGSVTDPKLQLVAGNADVLLPLGRYSMRQRSVIRC